MPHTRSIVVVRDVRKCDYSHISYLIAYSLIPFSATGRLLFAGFSAYSVFNAVG